MTVATSLLLLTVLCVFSLMGCCHGQIETNNILPGSCCVRRPKLRTLGMNLTGARLTVDEGECYNICDEMNSTRGWQACSGRCFPKKTVVERYYIIDHLAETQGPQNVNIIKWCACEKQKCRRMHKWMVYFQNTPDEKTVDVGHCAGNKRCLDDQGHHNSCRAVETSNEIINGSNGAEVVPVIRKCQCASSCYRMAEFKNVVETYTDQNGDIQTRWKRLDVGRCTGICQQDCHFLQRCPTPQSVKVCSPEWTTPPQYHTKDNKPVHIIERCNCSTWSGP